MGKRKLLFAAAMAAGLLAGTAATAQVRIPKGANRLTYYQINYGSRNDTALVVVELSANGKMTLLPRDEEPDPIPGYATTLMVADYAADSIEVSAAYADSTFYYRTPLSRTDLAWDTLHASSKQPTYVCHVNSNRLEFEMDEGTTLNASPLPYYGLRRGVLRSFTRNGQRLLVLAKAEKVKRLSTPAVNPQKPRRRLSPREMDALMKARLVQTTCVFDSVQIHFNGRHDSLQRDARTGCYRVPTDTVLHFAGGTLVLRKMRLPRLPQHYQHFAELHQQSNGDAYDRTGSVFIVPEGRGASFLDGIAAHPDSLPLLLGRDGERYQGVVRTPEGYEPPLELIRFFTPFGVGHFNERMAGYGIDWRREAYYRQEITDVYPNSGEEVIIGAWIGNYDGGGHIVTLNIRSYPNSYSAAEQQRGEHIVQPLFNTCNVLEMAGQNYGKLFGTDSLNVDFIIPADAKSATLRYISTGHGGWGEGDEFVPKTNTLLVDGEAAFSHTPWREDCGCYRDLNPVSGNFWNGLSSSDFSRSGWCPGTATQPVRFDLSRWADGRKHRLTVAIPQGQPVEGMFSHWAVSGVLVIER